MSRFDGLIGKQIEYYRARASEYDQWFQRQGRYDRGPEFNRMWAAEAEVVREAIRSWSPQGQVLELAAGTGLWTEHLISKAHHVTAVDASPEALSINRDRVGTERVTHLCADVFTWTPPREFDAVFFAFWLSHVPPDRLEAFFDLVNGCLVDGGSVFFVDSRFNPVSTAKDHQLKDENQQIVTRKLNDGREFEIVKIFYRPKLLARQLNDLGWRFRIRETENFFIHGRGERNR